jgi:hypothetical protein
VAVRVVRAVGAEGFENVFEVVGDEIETHEEEEDGHGEASEHFCAFETEGMTDGTSFPDFEVVEYVHNDADRGAYRIEEY